MLVEKSVREFLASLSDRSPTPGGGAASALASAMGTSLLMMVAALPKTRRGSDAERRAMDASLGVMRQLLSQLTEAVDADAAAYDAVVAAHRLAKTTDGERSARTAAIQQAFRVATDVPLTVVRLSARALDQARIIAPISHVPAASDLLSGVLLLNAGLTGAAANIEANVAALADTAYVRAVREEVGRLSPASPIEEVKALLSADDR